MHPLEKHERFELEVLDFMHKKGLLNPLVFGGGTMLRLCFDLNRYSADMDFYFKEATDESEYFKRLLRQMGAEYGIADHQNKFNTILVELKDSKYPRCLKIEINKEKRYSIYRKAIAFSKYSTHQVLLDAIPVEQMMFNKTEALLNRQEVRDAFDVEFLIRQGVSFAHGAEGAKKALSVIRGFATHDFNVKLGSLLPDDVRGYYRKNRFNYLEGQLNQIISNDIEPVRRGK